MKKLYIFFLFTNVLTINCISIKQYLKHNLASYIKVDKNGCLNLSSLKLTDLEGIESYPKIGKVTNLDLSNNMLSNILPLKKISFINLRILDISFNKIKDVSALLTFLDLQELYLENNQIDDDNLNLILKLPKLEKILLKNNPIKNQIYRENDTDLNFKKMFPNSIYIYVEHLIPVAQANENNNYCCSICLNEGSKDFIVTKCFHVFHEECLKRLIDNSPKKLEIKCPYCRQILN